MKNLLELIKNVSLNDTEKLDEIDALCELTFINNWMDNHEPKQTEHTVSSSHLPTEELAELHAIIQAIEWDRK